MLSNEQLERYSRHIILKEVGAKGQKKLLNAKVLIIGAGGLGAPAAMYLAAAGVGTIGIADADEVDLSNLQRQIIHSTQDVGKAKVQSAKETMEAINPDVKVITYRTFVDSESIMDLIKDYDFIIDGTDNFPAKFLINDACVMAKKPFSHAGIIRFKGQLMTYVPGEGPCYRCVFKNPPPKDAVPTCKQAGVIGAMGGVIGSLQAMESADQRLIQRGPSKVDPLLVPKMISNMAAGNVSIALGARGKCTNVVTACASGTHCIGDAFRAIQYGDADIMVAGGAESAISPTGLAGFTALTALSTSEDPTCASRPFDKDRDGFVLGEGAGIIVLEELEHAKARGAKIYAELAGYGATADAWHITSPAEDGEGAAMAMKLAMREAGVRAEQIDYINAHGTSTHHNDLFETRAIRSALGSAADQVVVNSTKSMIGHLLGAAGGVEFIVCVKSIQDGYIHQTMGTKNVDPECDLNYAVGSPVKKDVNYVLTNSLGFGGHNASLLVKKYED